LIQGKAAGVLVINNTGQPGGATTVRIRGTSSIRSGNQPLYVVDGVPLAGGSARPGGSGGDFGSDPGNPLAFINPNDIASMEILKDASATAIYGSRGANGVIIITTKRGKTGAPQLDASASTSVSRILRQLKVLNADEYRQALRNYDLVDSSGRLKGDFGGNVNAFDAITRSAITQNYNVAMSGGTENGRYRLSVGYLDQQGIIKTSELRKLTANLTSSFRFLESKKLGLDINVLVTQTDEQIAPISSYVGFTGNLISQALQWNPTHPLIKPGTDSAWIDPAVGATTINPLVQLQYLMIKQK
jgi:iron complex outermembrane receptor protein